VEGPHVTEKKVRNTHNATQFRKEEKSGERGSSATKSHRETARGNKGGVARGRRALNRGAGLGKANRTIGNPGSGQTGRRLQKPRDVGKAGPTDMRDTGNTSSKPTKKKRPHVRVVRR